MSTEELLYAARSKKLKCRRHEWSGSVFDDMAWPAKCRYCTLVTEDPDAYFRPRDWDDDNADHLTRCPGAPDGCHDPMRVYCVRCGHEQNPAVSKRNKNNRKRGGTWEREAAAEAGGRRMGQLNLPWDVEVPGYARIQTKQLDRWPSLNAVLLWLDAMGSGEELRIVALKDTPGRGIKSRKLAVLDWDAFCRWHGGKEAA